jgi:hypothetical protein
MNKVVKMVLLLMCTVVFLSACGTGTRFVLPEGTRIYLPAKDMTFAPGKAKSRPFFWNSFGGIDYQLMKEGKTVKEGQLESDFRVTSLFWPPFAILYWPVGFEWNCYDLTGSDPVLCNR